MSEYAVTYTSSQSAPTRLSEVSVLGLYRQFRYVRVTWVDYVFTVRHRIIPFPYFEKLLNSARPGVTIAKVVLGYTGNRMGEGFNGTGEYLYAVDMKSVRNCPFEQSTMSVMGWFEQKVPSPEKPLISSLCPRGTLRRILQ